MTFSKIGFLLRFFGSLFRWEQNEVFIGIKLFRENQGIREIPLDYITLPTAIRSVNVGLIG